MINQTAIHRTSLVCYTMLYDNKGQQNDKVHFFCIKHIKNKKKLMQEEEETTRQATGQQQQESTTQLNPSTTNTSTTATRYSFEVLPELTEKALLQNILYFGRSNNFALICNQSPNIYGPRNSCFRKKVQNRRNYLLRKRASNPEAFRIICETAGIFPHIREGGETTIMSFPYRAAAAGK